jgi:peptidoglycan/LPS O-acetylase OafA/YrhL
MIGTARKNREITGIDLLRFFCAFMVMASHLLSAHYTWMHYGGAGVEVFFIISGFIIPYSAEGSSPFKFIRSRIVRLVPGVWICATISVIALLAADETEKTGLLAKYIRSIAFIPMGPWVDGVYWTLFVEIAFYLLVLLLLFGNAFSRIDRLATALGCVTLYYWLAYFIVRDLPEPGHVAQWFLKTDFLRILDLTLVHHGAFFGLGINIWLIAKGERGRMLSGMVCALGGTMEIVHDSAEINRLSGVLLSPWIRLACVAAGVGVMAISIYVHSRKEKTKSDTVGIGARWIGLTTYPLYLMHKPLGLAFITFFAGGSVTKLNATWLAVLLVVVIAALIARFIEPVLQNIFKKTITKIGGVFEKCGSIALFAHTDSWPDGTLTVPLSNQAK